MDDVSISEVRAYKTEIADKFKNRRWFLGVGLTKINDKVAIKINVKRYPWFCRIPGDSRVEIVMEKTTMSKASENVS